MNLHPKSREFYRLRIVTDPTTAATVSASFDGGSTWFVGEAVGDGTTRWLIAGPEATVGTAVAVIPTGGVTPLLRWNDTPEVPVENAPTITVTAY